MSFSKSVSKKDRIYNKPQRKEPEPSYFHQVVRKLENHPEYHACSNEQRAELVTRITKAEELVKYFDLLDEPAGAAAAAKATAEVDTLPLVPVQVILKHYNQAERLDSIESLLQEEYGPLHAYVVIGGLIIEWNWKSTVIPHGKPIIEDTAGSSAAVAELPPLKVEELKSKVLSVVANYNKLYHYHPIQRDSHEFVCDILEAMGVQPPTQLQSKLKDYLETLTEKRSKMVPEKFATHAALDQFIVHVDTFSPFDMEYLVLQYFMFHLVSKAKTNNQSGWVCPENECKMQILAALIDQNRMILSNFRTVKYNFHQTTIM